MLEKVEASISSIRLPDDTVLFSTRVIPCNEASVTALQQRLIDRGCRVIHDDAASAPIQATGYPAKDELRAMYCWVRPRIAIQVHGEEALMTAHAELARAEGIPIQLRGHNGDLFLLAPQPGMRRGLAPSGRIETDR